MYWIQYRDEHIPQRLYYPGWQTVRDKRGRTPLMLWIKEGHGKAIPQELFYDGWQTDKDNNGKIPLGMWIDRNGGENIPRSLLEGYLK